MNTTDLPRTERYEAPLYLARYLERRSREPDVDHEIDDGIPLYLRRFRDRPVKAQPSPTVNARWAEVVRSKEIVAPPEARPNLLATVHLIRHAETQGYSVESGLTPLGSWQAHRRGFDLSKGVRDGDQVRLICADTARARQTAEHIHRGLLDGLAQWEHDASVTGPETIRELDNFRVLTPSGVQDVTAAFRAFHSQIERYERLATGERPLWMVEIDRFWKTQQGGGDPIHHWLTTPMLHFEPPTLCVRRFWRGLLRLASETPPGARIVAVAHSGPIRAFATWAHGYDPGEPYNTEEVVVQVREGGRRGLVAYRNRVTEVHVPPLGELPQWEDD